MIRRRSTRVVRAVASIGLLGAVLAAHGNAARAATSTQPPAVTLSGEGSWDPYREVTGWQDDLFGANGLIDLKYVPNGGFSGRQDYVGGNLDYVISGNPFTADELVKLKGADSLIDAPVFVSAVGFAVEPPFPQAPPLGQAPPNNRGWIVQRTPCDTCAIASAPYLGPVRLPAANIAGMLLGQDGGGSGLVPGLNRWDNPDLLAAWGITQGTDSQPPSLLQDPNPLQPVAVERSDPNETSYYLQQFAKQAAPDVWAAAVKAASRVGDKIDPITEHLPNSLYSHVGVSRDGTDQQALLTVTPTGSAADAIVPRGGVAPVPAGAMEQMKAVQIPAGAPAAKALGEMVKAVAFAEVKNAAGEWFAPTPGSIDAAVNAGGDHPLFALTNAVNGAYPLVYVDHLYAPAHGLSIAKTEALATTIRYLATAGQASTASHGDGQLSAALADRALAAADQLVVSNCVGAGTQLVTNSDPGAYAPTGSLTRIGPMKHCAEAPVQTTTTSTTAAAAGTSSTGSATTGSSGGSGGSGGGSSGYSTGSAVTAGATGSADPAPASAGSLPPASSGVPPASSGGRFAALTVGKLPLPFPGSGGSSFDRLTTMVAGAILLLIGMRIVRATARALGP